MTTEKRTKRSKNNNLHALPGKKQLIKPATCTVGCQFFEHPRKMKVVDNGTKRPRQQKANRDF